MTGGLPQETIIMVASIKLLESFIFEKSQNQFAMELNNLPQDLVMEILRRLNFKDIMKCKCTCKHWQALISNPTFLQYRRQMRLEAQSTSNYKQSWNPIRLLVCSSYFIPYITGITIGDKMCIDVYTSNNVNNEGLENLKLTPQNKRELKYNTEVISSSFLKLVLLYERYNRLLYLYNPSTDELMALPKKFEKDNFWSTCVGLGQVELTKEYKVVCVIQNHLQVICEVFTLGSDYQWREVAAPPTFISSTTSIFVASGMYMFDQLSRILRFDIKDEKWMEILLPNIFWLLPSCWTIQEVDGLLCMTNNSIQTISMWVLKDHEKGVWALEKSIYIDYNFRRFLNDVRDDTLVYPLSFDYGDGKMLIMFNDINMTILLSYDPITLHVEELPNPHSSPYITATFFTESFESLL